MQELTQTRAELKVRQAHMEETLGRIAGAACELTFRSEKAFTVTIETTAASAVDRICRFFKSAGATIESTATDPELGCAFVYFRQA